MFLTAMLLLPTLPLASPNGERVVIVVSDSPILNRADALGLSVSEASARFEPLLKQQVEWRLNTLRRMGIQFKVVDVLTSVLHGAVIEIYQDVGVLKSAAPDLHVYRDSSLKVNLEKSSGVVRAVEAHRLTTSSGEPLTGKGVVVAILDTGVDYTHPDLGGTIGLGQKIMKGYDFVDNDDDPMDKDGHGTEVAGIIAADGRLKGIAPEASILAYRIVDARGSVKSSDLVRALEKAVADGAEVVNLSLGTNEEIEVVSQAVRNVVKSGVVVVAATGNSGGQAFGEPAGRRGVIAVGASLNNVSSPRDAEVIVNPGGFELVAYIMNGSKPASNGVTGNLVYVKYARKTDVNSLDLRGAVALAERGGEVGELVYFSEKEANVATKGAVGLIVYNSEGGLFLGNLIGPQNPPGYEPKTPVVSIANQDGVYLRDSLNKGDKIEATILTSYRSAQLGADRVAFFSSKGPVSPFYIKPDIVAPGVGINTTDIKGEYAVKDGTSFSAPHVTGAAALLLQAHPGLTPEEVVGILAPTSKVMNDRWRNLIPSFTQGSGRLDVLSAVTSPLALDPYQLVFHVSSSQPNHTRTVKLIPVAGKPVSVSVNISWSFGSNISLTADQYTVDVKKEPGKISFTASVLQAAPHPYEGRITLSSAGYPNLTLPVIVYVNDASLNLEKVGDIYLASLQSDERFLEAKIHVTSPNGLTSTYSLRYGESVPVNLPYVGEYWLEAEASTSTGGVNARAVYDILEPTSINGGIPLRFLEIFGGFMLLAVAVASVMVVVNRRRQIFE